MNNLLKILPVFLFSASALASSVELPVCPNCSKPSLVIMDSGPMNISISQNCEIKLNNWEGFRQEKAAIFYKLASEFTRTLEFLEKHCKANK